MLIKIILLFTGGGIGTLCRYGLTNVTNRNINFWFPVGTMLVNITGCFIIGFFWGLVETDRITPNGRLFFMTGFLGGFTTFSTFMLENFNLMRDTEYLYFFINIILSNVIGFILVFAGFFLARYLVKVRG